MHSSFPNRWSFSYLKFTKYVTNIIAEPKYKYRQQEQVTVRNHNRVPPWNGQYKNTGGLKPVLRVPNLALSFCYMTGIMNNRNENVKPTVVRHWRIWQISRFHWTMVSGKNGYRIYSLNQVTFRWDTYEPYHDKTNKMACAPSEDSDQPGHPPSLISLRCALNG